MPIPADDAGVTRQVEVPEVAPPIGRYSHVAVVAPQLATAYISGQIGVLADGTAAGPGAEVQTRAALHNLEAILRDLDATPAAIVKLLTFVAGGEHVAGFAAARDAVFDDWYPAGDPPAHSLAVVAGLARADLVVEIEAIAGVAAR